MLQRALDDCAWHAGYVAMGQNHLVNIPKMNRIVFFMGMCSQLPMFGDTWYWSTPMYGYVRWGRQRLTAQVGQLKDTLGSERYEVRRKRRELVLEDPCWLVVWNISYFPIYWEWWSQFTNIFQRGLKPPTSLKQMGCFMEKTKSWNVALLTFKINLLGARL